jgi:carbon-monoxide dehydrogenase small subunit
MAKHHIAATVNGDGGRVPVRDDETLLDVLRNQLGLTGTKEGCSTGDCGAAASRSTGGSCAPA